MPPEIVKCPVCKKSVLLEGNPDRPFCSDRCRLIDLGAWASESYAVPGERVPGQHCSDPKE